MFLNQPDVFNAYLAATPAIDYEGGSALIMNNLSTYLAKNTYYDKFLYMGTENEVPLIPVLDNFVGVLDKAKLDGLKWEYHPFFDEDHGSIANKVIYHGLKFVFSEWNTIPDEVAAQGVGAIRAYVSSLDKRYGYDIGVSRIAIAMAIRLYREQSRAEDVIDLLKLSLEYKPDSEMGWLELGRVLESIGRLDQAKEALETAHKKAVQNSSPHLGIFKDALDKINQKLRQK
jgi:tetratricopeptide (TPR) repeat protein